VSGIGVRHSFFEVGGHSILGVRLLDEIERELAVPLPLAGLFEEATIERLAAIIRSIRGREKGADLGVLPPIQPNGSRPPLYCVHPSGGSVHYYFRFAHALDDDQPVYGLQAAGLEGDGEPDTTIEVMAARYVAEIRRFQRDGPYRLLGWSLGGIVVFEMARQLRDLGERVDLAAVVDADAVSYEPPPSRDDLLLAAVPLRQDVRMLAPAALSSHSRMVGHGLSLTITVLSGRRPSARRTRAASA
jgi:pimeloyl-ACP methyl ester carboxylesterase